MKPITMGRKLSALRAVHAGGRPPVETPCHKCGVLCPSAREARAHCKGKRLPRKKAARKGRKKK